MLIIAIPKSASTSLLQTLGRIHELDSIQDFSFSDNPVPKTVKYLFNIHSDIREISQREVEKFESESIFYKQHIFPSTNNLDLLKNTPKVLLLRKPEEIIFAYRRGIKKGLHKEYEGLSLKMDDSEWFNKAQRIGLYSDLSAFNTKWRNADDENILFLSYRELIESPKKEINKIESFFGLKLTEGSVNLEKNKFTRQNLFFSYIRKIKNKLKNINRT